MSTPAASHPSPFSQLAAASAPTLALGDARSPAGGARTTVEGDAASVLRLQLIALAESCDALKTQAGAAFDSVERAFARDAAAAGASRTAFEPGAPSDAA